MISREKLEIISHSKYFHVPVRISFMPWKTELQPGKPGPFLPRGEPRPFMSFSGRWIPKSSFSFPGWHRRPEQEDCHFEQPLRHRFYFFVLSKFFSAFLQIERKSPLPFQPKRPEWQPGSTIWSVPIVAGQRASLTSDSFPVFQKYRSDPKNGEEGKYDFENRRPNDPLIFHADRKDKGWT